MWFYSQRKRESSSKHDATKYCSPTKPGLDELELAILVGHLTGAEGRLATITIRFDPPRVQHDGGDNAHQAGAQRQTGRLEVLVVRDAHRLVALQRRIELGGEKKVENRGRGHLVLVIM